MMTCGGREKCQKVIVVAASTDAEGDGGAL